MKSETVKKACGGNSFEKFLRVTEKWTCSRGTDQRTSWSLFLLFRFCLLPCLCFKVREIRACTNMDGRAPGGERCDVGERGSFRGQVGNDWVTSFHFSLSCIGEGNGYPLRCSCLGNPMDRGITWGHKSGTWLSDWTTITKLWVYISFTPQYVIHLLVANGDLHWPLYYHLKTRYD